MMIFKASLASWLEQSWYIRKKPWLGLVPLSWFYRLAIGLRRIGYWCHLKTTVRLSVPVIVVGNITVGGTGKTPLTIWLARFLSASGFNPGIVSRGYGGRASQWPQQVRADSDIRVVGDEALVIARHTDCPMAVGPDRVAAAKALLNHHSCDVIISDDGLQHYALARDIEIAVVDSRRGFGNGYCIPAGPLREPVERMKKINITVYNGSINGSGYAMQIQGGHAVNIRDQSLTRELSDFSRQKIHALAGIGNPQRFFDHISGEGLVFDTRQFPDHHRYNGTDITYDDDLPVLMTEKDAVKCKAMATERHWYVPIEVLMDREFGDSVLNLLADTTNDGRKTT